MKTLSTSLIAATLSLAGWAGTAQAQAQVTYAAPGAQISVQFGAPPPMRYEAVPAARRGFVWAPGYWKPQGRRHVWMAGHWVKARPGYVYRQPAWSQQGGRWGWAPERWDRSQARGPNRGPDRDRDGVPNRHDRRPDNPYRH